MNKKWNVLFFLLKNIWKKVWNFRRNFGDFFDSNVTDFQIAIIPNINTIPFFQGHAGEYHKQEFDRHRCLDSQLTVVKSELNEVCRKYINSISLLTEGQALRASIQTLQKKISDFSSRFMFHSKILLIFRVIFDVLFFPIMLLCASCSLLTLFNLLILLRYFQRAFVTTRDPTVPSAALLAASAPASPMSSVEPATAVPRERKWFKSVQRSIHQWLPSFSSFILQYGSKFL